MSRIESISAVTVVVDDVHDDLVKNQWTRASALLVDVCQCPSCGQPVTRMDRLQVLDLQPAGHRLLQPVDPADAVAHGDDRADLRQIGLLLVILDLLADDLAYLVGLDLHAHS